MKKTKRKIAVIGGGASGMFAAISAAREGAEVVVFERNQNTGKKILSTGNGRCNLSNQDIREKYYHGTTPSYVNKIFHKCSPSKTLQIFHEMGIDCKNKNGYLYPFSEQAASVVFALQTELKRLHVNVINETMVLNVEVLQNQQEVEVTFSCKNGEKKKECFDKIILSCGSNAVPKSGSDGNGYRLCRKLGINLLNPLPSLTQCLSKESWLKETAGIRCDVRLTVLINGIEKDNEEGELQFTEKGLSGIVSFQLSGRAAREIEAGNSVIIQVNFLSFLDEKKYLIYIKNRIENAKGKNAEECLVGLFPQKLIRVLLRFAGIPYTQKTEEFTSKQISRLVDITTRFRVPIFAVNGFDQCQVCSGGVLTDELTENLCWKKNNNIYVTGELVDIDGLCGGYNLQWAWSTGYVAGKSAAND